MIKVRIAAKIVAVASVIIMIASPAFAQFEYLILQIMQQQQSSTSSTSRAVGGSSSAPGYGSNWDEMKSKFTGDDALFLYMQKNFTYESKAGDHQPQTLTPAQTNAAKGGSCADYSAFTSAALRDMGYKDVQEISYMWATGQGHVVTIYLDETGVDNIISNGQLVGTATDQASLKAVLAKAVGTDPAKIGDNIHYLPAEWLGGFDNNYKAP